MRKLILLLSIILLTRAISIGQINLTIEIEPLRNSTGQILLEFNNENEEVIKGISEIITENKCIIQIKGLQPGKYAFKYFHDENNDEKLTTNFVGMPKEGFGFSNNAKGKFGPPSFDKMLFEVSESDTIKCTPLYLLKKK